MARFTDSLGEHFALVAGKNLLGFSQQTNRLVAIERAQAVSSLCGQNGLNRPIAGNGFTFQALNSASPSSAIALIRCHSPISPRDTEMRSNSGVRIVLQCAICFLMQSLLAHDVDARVYDFEADGQEYSGNILGQNPLFTPGGVRSITQFNNLYRTSNGFIDDEFEVGAANPFDFRVANGYYTTWENASPVIPSWVNSREGFKFPTGSALGGEYSGFNAGEIVKFRAYSYRIGSGHFNEMSSLPFVDETSVVVAANGQTVPFRFDSLAGDVRSFAAFRVTPEGDFVISGNPMSTSSIELTTVPDTTPPPFRHAPTTFDFGDEGITYSLGAFQIDEMGEEALAKVNAAHDSSHGFHDEEFVIGHPTNASFRVGGGSSNGYAGRYLSLGGSAGHVNWWVNAKEGHIFPEDAAIGVTRYNPNWTSFDNGGNQVEVIIRAYAERIETGSFEELAELTVVGEARGLGFGTFNTPPVLNLMASARSFTVHTGDGNGNFVSFPKGTGYAGTALNQIIVDTVPEFLAGVPGDYNNDGQVDAADYTIWRDNVGADSIPNRGQGITGAVGEADYDFWKSQFAGIGGSGQASPVPEPSSFILIAFSGLQLLRLRRRFPRVQVSAIAHGFRTTDTTDHGNPVMSTRMRVELCFCCGPSVLLATDREGEFSSAHEFTILSKPGSMWA